MTRIQIQLSDDLARDARQAGLLEARAIEELLKAELARRQSLRGVLALTERAAAGGEALTEEEVRAFVQGEVDSHRAENRAARAGGS